MKSLSLSLLIFAMIILLSSALPVDKEKDTSNNLVGSRSGRPLQKRKPPGKLPGPKQTEEPTTETGEEGKEKALVDSPNGKKHSHLTADNSKESTGSDTSNKLVGSRSGRPLQKRKPPGKLPGPKQTEEPTTETGEEGKEKALVDSHKGKKHSHVRRDNSRDSAWLESLNSSDKHKKHLVQDNRYNGARQEETQEERSIIF